MPSPNGANKLSSRKMPEKRTGDLGQQLAKRRSQDFAAKIAGWDASGAGNADSKDAKEVKAPSTPRKKAVDEVVTVEVEKVVSTPAEVVDSEKEGNLIPDKPKTPVSGNKGAAAKIPATRKTSREVDVERKAWVRRKNKPQLQISPELKEATTPKKRVVSDGHWRRDRIQSKMDSPAEDKENAMAKEKAKETTPKPITVRRSVASVGLKIPPSVQNYVDNEPEPVKVRAITRRSRSSSRSPNDIGREAKPDYEDSGFKVYIKRQARQQVDSNSAKARQDFSTSESNLTFSSGDRQSTATDITSLDESPVKYGVGRLSARQKEKLPTTTTGTRWGLEKPSITPLETKKTTPRTNGTKADILTQTKERSKIPASNLPKEKEPSTAVPKVFSNRIEGWLADMPEDPFIDKSGPSLVVEPLKISRKKEHQTDRHPVDDFQPGDTRRFDSNREHRLRPSSDRTMSNVISTRSSCERMSVDEWSDSSSKQRTPTLKRSGAQKGSRSPIIGRPKHDSLGFEMSGALPAISHTAEHDLPASGSEDLRRPSGRRRASPTVRSEIYRNRLPSYKARPDFERGASLPLDGSVLSRASDGDDPRGHGTGLKRRPTKHSDLISVLSLPKEDNHPIVPARSIRTRRARPELATTEEIMNEITTDELKYQRELRTLVDGVVPVLLNYVLKSDSKKVSGAQLSSAPNSPALTQPIVNMAVALERLKATHKRIPMHDSNELLYWGEGAFKVYTDYLKVWRLGFHDVVVNLAPAEESSRKPSWDQGLERNSGGDLLKADGERVDVAYLLKRPLVRLKYLAKAFKGIDLTKPSAAAATLAEKYHGLVIEARDRANDERARLEDEAASSIDPTRARDLQSLTSLNGVSIDPTRNVRARDYFDMQLYHSSGQQLDCKIEVILRDDPSARGGPGDVLFCEISTTGRWLLFPPVLANLVSARRGDKDDDVVVMVRGLLAGGVEWREIMCLQSTESQATEWVQMFGTNPPPPRLTRRSSFNTSSGKQTTGYNREKPSHLDLPIGERADATARQWDGSEVNSVIGDSNPSKSADIYKANATRYGTRSFEDLGQTIRSTHMADQDENIDNPAGPYGTYDSRRRYGGGQLGQRYASRPSRTRAYTDYSDVSGQSTAEKSYSVWLPSSDRDGSDEESADEDDRPLPRRPSMRRRTSSVPSSDMPTINKIRKPVEVEEAKPSKTRYYQNMEPSIEFEPGEPVVEPMSAPSKLERLLSSTRKETSQNANSKPASDPKLGFVASLNPIFVKKHRRSSSPLKHEYEPSTASESLSGSEFSDSEDEGTITSESSNDEMHEGISTLGELKDFSRYGTVKPIRDPPRPTSSRSIDADTLGPSESASQAPFRQTPTNLNAGSAKTVACIFCWSDSGSWESLHPQECEIVVTAGLIEAFDLAQANQVSSGVGGAAEPSPSQRGVKPLVALELTPLVPLRRGTALDISIRSPPTSNSLLRASNHIMFRSRSPEECEKLYGFINRARIDNPTWIALQNARGPIATSNWAEVMDRRNAARTNNSGSWFKSLSRKSSTYRSKRSGAVSTGATESSNGTMNSTMSALRRFTSGSRVFNIAKSTITSREGTRSSGSDSLSSGAATPIPLDGSMGTPVGITNAKIRLYMRESASRWNDLGSAHLTVLFPPRDPNSITSPPDQNTHKRVLVTGKTQSDVILDVTLPEGNFERVARTGIAVSVWEEATEVGATGGVVTARARVFMLQMKSERDAAYTFSTVGKLRY